MTLVAKSQKWKSDRDCAGVLLLPFLDFIAKGNRVSCACDWGKVALMFEFVP